MRVSAVGALVLLLALSGCSAFAGGSSNTPTLTPADVPTETPTPADPRVGVAPGVSASGVTHPGFLVQRHVEVASEERYVWEKRFRKNRTLNDETSTVRRGQRIVVENATVYRRDDPVLETTVDGESRFLYGYSEWANGETLYRSWYGGENGERIFSRRPDPEPRPEYAAIPAASIQKYLTLDHATVSRYDVAGSNVQHYLVTGSRSRLPRYGNVSNYSTRAVIRNDGFVRSLNVSFDATLREVSVSVQYTFTYREVGTATVTPPEWAEEATAKYSGQNGSDDGATGTITDEATDGQSRESEPAN